MLPILRFFNLVPILVKKSRTGLKKFLMLLNHLLFRALSKTFVRAPPTTRNGHAIIRNMPRTALLPLVVNQINVLLLPIVLKNSTIAEIVPNTRAPAPISKLPINPQLVVLGGGGGGGGITPTLLTLFITAFLPVSSTTLRGALFFLSYFSRALKCASARISACTL